MNEHLEAFEKEELSDDESVIFSIAGRLTSDWVARHGVLVLTTERVVFYQDRGILPTVRTTVGIVVSAVLVILVTRGFIIAGFGSEDIDHTKTAADSPTENASSQQNSNSSGGPAPTTVDFPGYSVVEVTSANEALNTKKFVVQLTRRVQDKEELKKFSRTLKRRHAPSFENVFITFRLEGHESVQYGAADWTPEQPIMLQGETVEDARARRKANEGREVLGQWTGNAGIWRILIHFRKDGRHYLEKRNPNGNARVEMVEKRTENGTTFLVDNQEVGKPTFFVLGEDGKLQHDGLIAGTERSSYRGNGEFDEGGQIGTWESIE